MDDTEDNKQLMKKVEDNFIQNSILKTNHSLDNLTYDNILSKSVVVKINDGDKYFYITYKLDRCSITLNSKPLVGIEIKISTSMVAEVPYSNVNVIKPILENAIRLLLLSFHQKFDSLSPENQALYDEVTFDELKTNLLKLTTGKFISYIYYYNENLSESHVLFFQKLLYSIFDSAIKPTFLHLSSSKVSTNIANFILIYDRSDINVEQLKVLKKYLIDSMKKTKLDYKTFISNPLNNTPLEDTGLVPSVPVDVSTLDASSQNNNLFVPF